MLKVFLELDGSRAGEVQSTVFPPAYLETGRCRKSSYYLISVKSFSIQRLNMSLMCEDMSRL